MKRIHLLLLILASTIRAEDSGSALTTRATASTQRPVCTNNNWAPSSAFYFLLALALGCLSHPRGSVIFTRSSRVWRLSPLFLLIENVQILIHIFQCARSQGWRALRVYAYAILALREGNAWCQGEYDAFFSDEVNGRFLEQEEDSDNGEQAESTGVNAVLDGNESGIQMDDLEPSTSRLTRRTNTTALEEGRGSAPSPIGITAARSQVGDPGKISLDDWFTIGRWVPFSEIDRNLTHGERVAGTHRMSALADKKAAQLLDAKLRENLEQVQDFEKGPTYRLIIWYPMVQQLAKATQVGFSGAWFTISVGMLFLVSFVVAIECANRSDPIGPSLFSLSFIIVIWIFSLVFLAAVPIFISIGLANRVLKYQRYFSKSPDRQISRFNPAVTAITTALLAFMAYFGLGTSGGLSYDCSTTVQSSFYNLLG